jgi:hypothetical protein
MNLYSIICSICSFFVRIWFYIAPPCQSIEPLFKPRRQRQAARSGDRFAFA